MGLIEEYRKSLKMAEAEEVLDLVFYRPIAFALVKAIFRLPITPNQVTILSLLCGLASAFCFASGSHAGAAIWFLAANILDCSDGQLARLQKSGTPLGRIIDGVIDYVISVAIFLALGVGLTARSGDAVVWYLVVAAGISSAIHAIFFDYYQQEFISAVRGEQNFIGREIDRFQSEIRSLREAGTGMFRRSILTVYLRYMRIQERSELKKGHRRQYPGGLYRSKNLRIIRWWSFLGSTTNRSLLILAAFAGDPSLFLWIVVTLGNLWLVVALLWQRSIYRRLEGTGSVHAPAEA